MSTITTLNDWITGASFRWQLNTNFANLNTDKAEKSGWTFTGDISVPDEAYWAGWNGSLEVPTKNAIYDEMETKQDVLTGLTASVAELNYTDWVTSSIQTQLNGKQWSLTLTTTWSSWAATLIWDTLNIPQYTGWSGWWDVYKVWTPVNNQVGVWNGDGTLEGDSALTFDTATDTLTSWTFNSTALTASELIATDASKNLVSLPIATYPSPTEIAYVKGVTSSIHTQLWWKASSTLDNLGTTAINTSLVSDTDNTDDLGSTLKKWANLFVTTIGATATRVTKWWFTDLEVTNAIAGSITGNAATVTVADESADTSCYPLFSTAASGSLAPKTNTNVTLNSSTWNFAVPYLTTDEVIKRWGTGNLVMNTTPIQVSSIEVWHATDTTISRVSPGVIAVEWKTILTTDGGTLTGDITLWENTSIALDPAGSADGKYSGITISGTAGATLAFGDVIVLDVTASKWLLADANSAAAADGDARGLIGMCVLAANDTQTTTILLNGTCRADANFPALTITAPVYLSETAWDIVVAQPTTTDAVIRVLWFALTTDEIYFNPSSDYITHV